MTENERKKLGRDWKTKVLNPFGFLMALSFTTFVHGLVVNGIMNVNVSTIERRYHLNSYESGLISSCYDIAFCIMCPLVTYYGNHHHRPRIMALGMFIFAVGCVINALPQFFGNRYTVPENYTDLCIDRNKTTSAANEHAFEYFYVFLGGFILLGIGSIPIVTLGVAYLEDSTTKEKAASYIGLVGGISSFGSVAGYLLGGYMLSFYVDFHKLNGKKLTLSSEDPVWVGAWWISLLSAAFIAIMAMTPLLLFPKELPGTRSVRSLDRNETHAQSGSAITEKTSFGRTIRDFPTASKLLLRNPTFFFTILAASFESFSLNGFAVFLPKLLQNQFHITPTKAALLAGSVSVPGAIMGHIVSGYVVRKYSMKAPRILRAVSAATFLSSLLIPCMLLHCPRDISRLKHATGKTAESLCEADCHCDDELFRPVCGDNDIEYFSACHAGCRNKFPKSLIFHNCSCILSISSNTTGQAIKGSCATQCNLLIPFLILLFILISLSFAVLTPSVVVVMRCVPHSQKSYAVGVQWFFIRVIGSIPSPLVVGAVFDACCAIWRKQGGKTGGCWIYDSPMFARYAVTIAATCKILTLLCYTMAYRLYKPETESYNSAKRIEQRKPPSLSQSTPETEFIQL